MRDLLPRSDKSRFQVCLDDGADECQCACGRFESRGAVLETPWRFEPMQSLTVAVACDDPSCKCVQATREAVVLDCRKLGEKRYQTTVLFVDPSGDPSGDSEELTHVPA